MRPHVQRRLEGHPSVERATRLFLESRLTDRETMLWAARLSPDQSAERNAVRDLVRYGSGGRIAEPYCSAWRYILEGWANEITDADMTAFHIQSAIQQGLEPRMVLSELVDLVEPRVRIGPVYGRPRRSRGRRTISKVGDLLPIDLSPVGHASLSDVGLDDVADPALWEELVDRLDGSLVRALHQADRLNTQWLANWVARVYPGDEHQDNDPDRYREGFAPIARLYSAALAKLILGDPLAARRRLDHLGQWPWKLTRRLWAAGARVPEVIPAAQIEDWLDNLSDDDIWDLHDYPEFAELRAKRFPDLTAARRAAFEARVRKGPPLSAYRRGLSKDRKRDLQRQAAVLEMRRLAASGVELTVASNTWLESRNDVQGSSEIRSLYIQEHDWPNPEPVALELEDPDLPANLNAALTADPYVSSRDAIDAVAVNWDALFARLNDDPRLLKHGRLLGALASTQRDLWIGIQPESEEGRLLSAKTDAFLNLLPQVPLTALADAAVGLGYWFDGVPPGLLSDPRLREAWLRIWPYAVAETNNRLDREDGSTPLRLVEDSEDRIASTALNSGVGRMLSAFDRMLPRGGAAATAFNDPQLRAIRDLIVIADGEAGRQGLYRLLLLVRYLDQVDADWTRTHLLRPLREDRDPALWDAISRIPLLAPDAFAEIVREQIRKVSDDRLAVELRARLAERVVVPIALALEREETLPAPLPEVEQMLRMGGDAVRARCASALVRFLEARPEPGAYARLVKPIITTAWPKDNSALSPALSDALAPLPAAARDAFAESFKDIEGLLVPFDAWSLWEYRLYEKEGDSRTLRALTSEAEAFALLHLLNRTIGYEERAVRPRDLDLALEAIAARSKSASKTLEFARLTALTRW